MSATSRACRTVGFGERHGTADKRAAQHRIADRRPTDQVSAWQAERGSRPTRRHPRSSRGSSRGNCFRGIYKLYAARGQGNAAKATATTQSSAKSYLTLCISATTGMRIV